MNEGSTYRLVGPLGAYRLLSVCRSLGVYRALTVASSAVRRCSGRADATAGAADDVVDEAVLEGLPGSEPAVAVGVGLDPLHRLPGVLRDQLGHLLLGELELLGLDPDVRG